METLNRYFGTEIEHERGDYLVLSEIHDAQEIEEFRRTFNPMCRYCAHELTTKVPWKRSHREMSEWLAFRPSYDVCGCPSNTREDA